MKNTHIIQKAWFKAKLRLKDQSPIILTCAGALGVVITSIITAKATSDATERLKKATREKGENLTRFESVLVGGPSYLPAIFLGASTIACIFGANLLNKRKQVSLASAYALLNQSYMQYKRTANFIFGEEADSKIVSQMAKDAYVSADGCLLYSLDEDLESEKTLFYDLYSQRYFVTTMAAVLNAQYHINRNLSLRGFVSVNEFYDFLGIDNITCGDEFGWSMDDLLEDGFVWLDFENRYTELEDGMKCYVVSSFWNPGNLSL